MNIANVMDQLGAAVDTIAGVRVFPYWADKVTPPAAVVGWPEPLQYDSTFARGADRATFPITLIVGKVDVRSARNDLSRFLDGSGAASVKAAVDGHVTAAWQSVRVQSVEVAVITISSTDYLGAEFQVDVIGSGA